MQTTCRWFVTNGRNFPWRRTRDPFIVLLTEVLLQKTLAPKVLLAYPEIIRRFGTPESCASARETSLAALIRPLGLISRAKTLKRLSRAVLDDHAGRVPADRGQLLQLPGVGAYTASAVRCFAFGANDAIVDTNVVRLFTRYFGLGAKTPMLSIARLAEFCLPKTGAAEFNWALLDLSALACKSRNPRCSQCPLVTACNYARVNRRAA